jgi:hypothetical protein
MVYSFQTSRHDATYFLKGRKPDYTPNMTKFPCFANLLNLPIEVETRPLLRYLSLSGVLELQFKRGKTHWKANIPGYNIYEKPSLNFIIFWPESFLEPR